MSSVCHHHLLPTYYHPHHHPPHRHHHQRGSQPCGGRQTDWRKLPSRGAEINLLANSLTSRLRHPIHQRARPSSLGRPPRDNSPLSPSVLEAEWARLEARPGRREGSHLDRPGSVKAGLPSHQEQTYRRSLTKVPRSAGAHRNSQQYVSNTKRPLSSLSGLEALNININNCSGQQLDGAHSSVERSAPSCLERRERSSPALLFVGVSARSTGGRPGAAQVMWVKRSGIFQPADKYATGRQTLCGEDSCQNARSLTIDYEFVTINSRSNSPESSTKSGRCSSKTLAKKGLKVSWKTPDVLRTQTRSSKSENLSAVMSRSGSAVNAEAVVRPKKLQFVPGKNRVPLIGLKWKVPVPKTKTSTAPSTSSGSDDSSSTGGSGRSSPASARSYPSIPQTQSSFSDNASLRHTAPSEGRPVSSAVTQPAPSQSTVKERVPGMRKGPSVTNIEDLISSKCQQWHPGVHPRGRRARMNQQSIQQHPIQQSQEHPMGAHHQGVDHRGEHSEGVHQTDLQHPALHLSYEHHVAGPQSEEQRPQSHPSLPRSKIQTVQDHQPGQRKVKISEVHNHEVQSAEAQNPEVQSPRVQYSQRQTSSRRTPEGRTPEGHTPQGRILEGKSSEKQNQDPVDQIFTERAAEKGTPEKGTPEKRTHERGTPEKRTPERGTPEKRTSETGTPERRTPERRTPERGDFEKRTPERRTPERRTPERQIPERRSSEEQTPERGSPGERSVDSGSPEEPSVDSASPEERAVEGRSADGQSSEEEDPDTLHWANSATSFMLDVRSMQIKVPGSHDSDSPRSLLHSPSAPSTVRTLTDRPLSPHPLALSLRH